MSWYEAINAAATRRRMSRGQRRRRERERAAVTFPQATWRKWWREHGRFEAPTHNVPREGR